MDIIFYTMYGDHTRIRKDLQNAFHYEGTLREESPVVNPVITVATEEYNLSSYNYVYIPIFQRYYYITEITSIRNNVWELQLHVDVLMSWSDFILGSMAIIDKQQSAAKGSPYIDDNSLVTTVKKINQTITFQSGFNSTPEYILTLAGGETT